MAKSSSNWIKGAIKRPGAFSAKARRAGISTSAYASKMSSAPGRTGRQARLAKTLMSMRKGSRKSSSRS